MSSGPTATFPLDPAAGAAIHGIGGGKVGRGNFFLSAALAEMVKIRNVGINISDTRDFMSNARAQYDALTERSIELQKHRKTLNPFKAVQISREARSFCDASMALYLAAQMESDRIAQQIVAGVPGAEMHAPVSPEDAITGIAIDLPHPFDDDALQLTTDSNARTLDDSEGVHQ